jgi:CubicO group peptidase (beta-lactamase class C family)
MTESRSAGPSNNPDLKGYFHSAYGSRSGWHRLIFATILAFTIVFPATALPARPPQNGDAASASNLEERIRRVENGPAPVTLGEKPKLAKLMEKYHIPGLSIAVIDNFKIAWAKGYGVTESGGPTPVTTHTLFQAGSVSKPVAAMATMSLVEQGKLSLDEDVNVKLKSWKVPENKFTKDQKVTLRRILSHTAGLTVHGFRGYAVDETVPTLGQILNGEKPANNVPVRVKFVPGSKWAYSGGGKMIEQQLLIDVTGQPFPRILQEAVFDKLGTKDSTYEQPLPAWRVSSAATGTYASGRSVRGKWHVYPEMAAAGLWTTPSDLATIAIEIALSKQGKANHVLSETTTHEMLRPQVQRVSEISLGMDRMGLGFFLSDAAHSGLFGHIGDDEGFQAILMMFGDSGKGVAVMSNSENGFRVGEYLIQNIAREYGWDYSPRLFSH